MLNRTSRSRGFSLIELMVAVAILAILAGMAAPSFNAWIDNAQVRNAAEEIQNGVQQARATAVQLNGVENPDLSKPWPYYKIGPLQDPPEPITGAANASLAITPDGTTKLTFNGLGRMTAPAADVSIEITNPTGGACVTDGGRVRCLRLVITTIGQVRMCDPARSSSDPQGCPD